MSVPRMVQIPAMTKWCHRQVEDLSGFLDHHASEMIINLALIFTYRHPGEFFSWSFQETYEFR